MKRASRAVQWTVALAVAGWAALAWLALDMDSLVAQWTMPADARWDTVNLLAIGGMWAVMMAAMMLPSALPMVGTFVQLDVRRGESARAHVFVAGYLLVWAAFAAAAVAAQWALQAAGWINPMIVSTSAVLSGVLLAIAGVWQFTPLKRVCLSRCRTPLGFLLGQWRGGTRGAFAMGWRHGLLCLGCCWALMALLFVGGAMNLPWVVALSVAAAIEKLVPGGQRVALLLGGVLIAAGAWRLLVLRA